jgi:hypothetical protein
MRLCTLVAAILTMLLASAADAKVVISIDKSAQRMTVAVDGTTRWTWPVSTGRPGRSTPSGSFQAFRMEEDHYSKEWDDAPMPHSIFFTKRGHAIHGSFETKRLGRPVSAGCVRLHPNNAKRLFALVKQQGVLNATVVITGQEPRVSAPSVARPAPKAAAQNRQPASSGHRAPAYRPQPDSEHFPPPQPGYMYAPPGYHYR